MQRRRIRPGWRVALCCLGVLLPLSARAESGRVLTAERVEAAVHRHVLQQGPWQAGEVEVRVRAVPPLRLPGGEIELQVVRPRQVIPGLRSFLLAVGVTGREITKVWVQAEIRIFAQVVVTSRPLAHHEVITADAVRLERREISTLATRAFTKIEEVVDRQAARALAVNEILTPALVQQPRVLRRGSAVTLLYESSALRVETSGQALEGGKIGDRIRVKNSSSGKVLEGQILDARTVRVH
ncbi:MAG: flagellar basal body P-ring formation chaperone FlgA [Candidatus Binatia bacterium]|nr:flagellar basal body P-ring formation chaperone FlgA [Candidatus Binatia bacterium]